MKTSNIRRDLEDNMTFVAGYCRLSRDEDKENYASIEEQKRIIIDYASSRNWICLLYTSDAADE